MKKIIMAASVISLVAVVMIRPKPKTDGMSC